MKGFITKAWHGLCLSSGLLLVSGCLPCYHNVVDTCYPERYNAMARTETNQAFGTQVQNGHVLDQTIWNYYFEPGTAKLNPGGIDHLVYLVRRRPCPDTTIYVQTAQPPDVTYNPSAPDLMVKARTALDAERVAAVQKFLAAEAAGTALTFNVLVHNPGQVGMAGVPANNGVSLWYTGPVGGVVPVGVGSAATGQVGGGGRAGTTGSF